MSGWKLAGLGCLGLGCLGVVAAAVIVLITSVFVVKSVGDACAPPNLGSALISEKDVAAQKASSLLYPGARVLERQINGEKPGRGGSCPYTVDAGAVTYLATRDSSVRVKAWYAARLHTLGFGRQPSSDARAPNFTSTGYSRQSHIPRAGLRDVLILSIGSHLDPGKHLKVGEREIEAAYVLYTHR